MEQATRRNPCHFWWPKEKIPTHYKWPSAGGLLLPDPPGICARRFFSQCFLEKRGLTANYMFICTSPKLAIEANMIQNGGYESYFWMKHSYFIYNMSWLDRWHLVIDTWEKCGVPEIAQLVYNSNKYCFWFMAHMTRVTRHTNLASCVGSHLIGIPFILSNIFTKDVFIYIVMYIYMYVCVRVCI